MAEPLLETTLHDSIHDNVIDIGSKNIGSLQYRYMHMDGNVHIIHANLPKIDARNLSLFDKSSFNFVFMFFLLDHIYEYDIALKESHRVLKTDGSLIGSVPLLAQFHADPNDYFRFTDSALHRMLISAGYSSIQITPLGIGPFTAAIHIVYLSIKPKILRICIAIFALGLDKITGRLFKRDFTLGYLFKATK